MSATTSPLPPEVARVLRKTDPRRWHHYALLVDAETGERLMLRSELVAWLRASDLPELAHEAHRRAVPAGAILVLTLNPEHGPTFRVLCDPRRAAR